MFGIITQRFFHVGKASMTVTKSSVLAKLRKATGYSVSNCKKALEMFPGDIKKAEDWLHEEAKSKGWAKWAKIQNRTAAQGLIGVYSQDNIGVMLEVNCETDFVSRNTEFHTYVAKMLSGCLSYAANLKIENDVTKELLEESQLNAVKCETSTLGELLVAATCKFNEKTVAKRAVCLKVINDLSLHSLSHPAALCPNLNGASLGKYGALLASKKVTSDVTEDADSLQLNVCQHIIGMNPSSVGQLTDKDIAKFSEKNTTTESANDEIVEAKFSEKNTTAESVNAEIVEESPQLEKAEDSDEALEGQEEVETTLKDSNETRLLFQPYLLDPSVTVGEIAFKSGLEVVSIERFECGESVEEHQPEVAQLAG